MTTVQPPQSARLHQCPGGPLLVRGAEAVVDDDGRVFPVNRPVVAVCVCGSSQRRPWCDGTHKVLQQRADPPHQ